MPNLRIELQRVVDQLLIASEASREVTLDALGEAVGVLSVSYTEVDMLIAELEAQGRSVVSPPKEQGEELLRALLISVRQLAPELGRRPTQTEIAAHAGLTPEQVRHALLLAKVMQR